MKNNTLTAPSTETYAKVKQLEEKAAELKVQALKLKERAERERNELFESFLASSGCENMSSLILELRAFAREKNTSAVIPIVGRPPISDEIKTEAKHLLITGRNPKEVSKKLGVSIATVYNIKHELPALSHAA